MTPRQQRRLEQKLARKAEKKQRACKIDLVDNHVHPEQTAAEQNRACKQAEVFPHTSSAPPLSEAKLAANRANSKLSHGAVTTIGKQIVSQNATKHGLTGKFRVLPSESQEEFDQMLAGFFHSENPVGEDEVAMVHQMAQSVWLSNRCMQMQNECYAVLETGTEQEQRAAHKSLALYLRYQTTHDRTFTRYVTELRKRRNETRRVERGFVSQKHKEAAEARRQKNEMRKQELHELRKSSANFRNERVAIQNRIAAAKAERLELQNTGKKEAQTMAAAA